VCCVCLHRTLTYSRRLLPGHLPCAAWHAHNICETEKCRAVRVVEAGLGCWQPPYTCEAGAPYPMLGQCMLLRFMCKVQPRVVMACTKRGVGLHLHHTLYSNVRPLDRAFTRLQARLGSCCACAALHACMHAFAHTLQLNLAMLPRALTLAHGASPRPHGKGANLAYMVPSALTRVG